MLEHSAQHVFVVCRRRNLTAPKMVSWLISQTSKPAAAATLLRAFEPMYSLVCFDPWTAHSVTSDSKKSVARIAQKTVFGVTDVYFLALYYKKAEVIEDEIKELTRHAARLSKGSTLLCEVILKVVGIQADPAVDKVLGISELVGLWVHGDALRPCCCNAVGVNAQNFGSFSLGPGIAANATVLHHFLMHPEELADIRESLPSRRADARPAYSADGQHLLATLVVVVARCPALASRMAHFDAMKSRKQHLAHPLHQYLEECRQEWCMYIEMFGTDDMPAPPYPYTEELMVGFIAESNDSV